MASGALNRPTALMGQEGRVLWAKELTLEIGHAPRPTGYAYAGRARILDADRWPVGVNSQKLWRCIIICNLYGLHRQGSSGSFLEGQASATELPAAFPLLNWSDQ